MELICQENGDWGGTEVFECVDQGNYLECYEIAIVIIGGILGVIIISVSAVFVKRWIFITLLLFRTVTLKKFFCVFRKADKTRKINESKRNLTIVEEKDYNQSYVSYSEEMDVDLNFVDGDMTKAFCSTDDAELTESSESEIDVENL